MRRVITDQIGAAARNGHGPVAGLFFKQFSAVGVNVIANKTGNHNSLLVICRDNGLLQDIDASAIVEV